MSASNNFITKPVLSTVCSLLIVIVGLIAIPILPIDNLPDIAPPTVKVQATYVGGAMSGRFSIGRIGIAIKPTITISRLQTVLRTGLVMKLLEADIVQPQFALAGCTCTGMPCFRLSRLVVTTI